MNATVALTGQGGWPMTCFLTPDGRPFFCGTYYPKVQFLQLLSAVAETWRERRGEVEQASDQITGELRKMASGLPNGGPPASAELCDHAVAAVLRDEDAVRGGFFGRRTEIPAVGTAGGAAAHLRAHRVGRCAGRRRAHLRRRWPAAASTTSWPAASPATASTTPGWYRISRRCCTTTRCCCARTRTGRGGPDRRWRTASRGRPPTSCCNDLADGDLFISSLDADADGHEGSTYVWTPAQLRDVLGDDDGRWAASVFGVTEAGTFEHGTSVLQLPVDADDAGRLDRVRAALLAARGGRVQPARDDKVVTAWNGLAITALAEAVGGTGPARTARRRGDVARRTCWPRTSSMDGCAGPASAGSSATAPRSSRTTRRWRRAWRRCISSPASSTG